MSHSLNSSKGGYIREYIGDYLGLIKWDARSLDYGSSSLHNACIFPHSLLIPSNPKGSRTQIIRF